MNILVVLLNHHFSEPFFCSLFLFLFVFGSEKGADIQFLANYIKESITGG